MAVIKNVAIAGASGTLGSPILEGLIASKDFNVTVLTRHSSNPKFPTSVRTVPVDYDSLTELTSALRGQDAVVSALAYSAINNQFLLIDAAVAAGVKRFIPSEFSSDIGNPKTASLPVYQPQIAVQKALQEKAQVNCEFTYTIVRNNLFLDWGISHGFHVNFSSETPFFYDGGDRPFSTTTLATIAKAVVGVLNHFEETKNRPVFVHDLVTTQRKLLSIAQKIAPERKWNPINVSTARIEESSQEKLAKGIMDMVTFTGFICRAIFAEGYGGKFENVDNELLGIGFKTDADLEELVKGALDSRSPAMDSWHEDVMLLSS